MIHPFPRPRITGPSRGGAGFSLVEFLIAIALLASSFLMGAISGSVNLQTMVRNLTMGTQESLIDQDLAQIRQLAETYSWCAGRGAFPPLPGGECASDVALRRDYYFPNVPPAAARPDEPPVDSAAIADFTAACESDALTTALVGAIDGLARPDGLTLTRAVALQNPAAGIGAQNHVLRISYRQNPPDPQAPIERDALIVPTVAAWCP